MGDRYEIRVRGTFGPAVAETFAGLDVMEEPRETMLFGELPDQAALFGVLDRLETLGVELIEVRRLVERSEPVS